MRQPSSSFFAFSLRSQLLLALGVLPAFACSAFATDPPPCTESEPMIEGADTGYFTCREGYSHRVSAERCATTLPRSTKHQPISPDTGNPDIALSDQCLQDSDCPENGYCEPIQFQDGPRFLHCASGCREDTDCAENSVCVCGDPVGHCVPSDCSTDADCGGNSLCLGTNNDIGCGTQQRFACTREEDECLFTSDCSGGQVCTHNGSHRECSAPYVCGRPFYVLSEDRRAPSVARGDWSATLQFALPLPDMAETRQQLAQHWEAIGLMEHASVAAFARFSLHLLALGAPPELLALTHQALQDEVRHAQVCFALASHYKGQSVGPGPLPMTDVLTETSAEQILEMVLLEGCIGETQAALQVSEGAAATACPELRELLQQISIDESRHAELAWRFVGWLLKERPELTSVVQRVWTEARSAAVRTSRLVSGETSPRDAELADQGVLSKSQNAQLRELAWKEILDPCFEQLFQPVERLSVDVAAALQV